MKKLLLTGFVPFLHYPINPTEDIATSLDGVTIGDYEIIGRVLPVDYMQSAKQLIEHYDAVRPDVVISLGMAAGRHQITPERIAINCRSGEPDNRGVRFEDEPIEPDGPAGYFATLPIRRILIALKERGYPAEISNTAGTYLCNNVMYSMLHKIALDAADVRAGFIHLPASHELAVKDPKLPSWPQQDLRQAVVTAIMALDGEPS